MFLLNAGSAEQRGYCNRMAKFEKILPVFVSQLSAGCTQVWVFIREFLKCVLIASLKSTKKVEN